MAAAVVAHGQTDVWEEPTANRFLVFWTTQLCPSKSGAKTTPLSPKTPALLHRLNIGNPSSENTDDTLLFKD